MSNKQIVLLAAGGTGGHLFPAEALAAVLTARGVHVELATDARVLRYGAAFEAQAVHAIPSATFGSRSPVAVARSCWRILKGILRSIRLIRRLRPDVVVGFGGYPSLPPLVAAQLLRVPTVVHEQNVVLGRANRVLGRFSKALATGFPKLVKASPSVKERAVHIGNPVRNMVQEVADIPYAPPQASGDVRLVIFGGSQGAKVMSDVAPAALAMLPAAIRVRLKVVHQARGADELAAATAYKVAGIEAQVAPFFGDLPKKIAEAHLVVCRGGASTIAELMAIGRPAIIVPLPGSLDQDQMANARALCEPGGGTLMPQPQMTPSGLAALISRLLGDPATLARQAATAKQLGVIDASERLADLVQSIAAGHQPTVSSFEAARA